MILLSIDSSTLFCSVAIHRNGSLVFSADNLIEKSASSVLTFLVQSALESAGIEPEEINAIAIGEGPGSYTGLRVAGSVAKGLCFALDLPLIAVNTLAAMAYQVAETLRSAGSLTDQNRLLLVPMIDARRMEVYSGVYDLTCEEKEAPRAVIVDAEAYSGWTKENRLLFFGDGAEKCRSLLEPAGNAHFWETVIHPQAAAIGALGYKKFKDGVFVEASAFEPLYLKEFQTKPARKL